MRAMSVRLCIGFVVAALALPGQAAADPIDDARAAVAAAPADPAGYEALGRLQQQAGDIEGAITTWQALIAAAPEYARGRYRLALALRKAGRPAEAADAYRAYIERAPDDPDARFGLAKTLEQLGDRAGALDAYRAYVRLETRPSEADWVAKARASITELEAAPAAAPAETPAAAPADPPAPPPVAPATPPRVELLADGDGARVPVAPTAEITLLDDTLVGRTEPAADAEAAFREGRHAAAAAAWIEALAARPDDAALHYRVAVAAALAGDHVTAEHHAGAALRLDPGNLPAADLARAAHVHRLRVELHPAPERAAVERALRDGRLRTAARLAETVLALGPPPGDVVALLRLRGRALLGLGRADEAFAALKAAAALHPPSPDLWGELALAADRRGDREAARALRDVAARVADPAHPLADLRPAPQDEVRR